MTIDPKDARIVWDGIVINALEPVRVVDDEPVPVLATHGTGSVTMTRLCPECGGDMMDLGELDDTRAGVMMCRHVVAYGFELARRGDPRPVTHALMRADGQRYAERVGVEPLPTRVGPTG